MIRFLGSMGSHVARSLMFVGGFAAIGVTITLVSHAATPDTHAKTPATTNTASPKYVRVTPANDSPSTTKPSTSNQQTTSNKDSSKKATTPSSTSAAVPLAPAASPSSNPTQTLTPTPTPAPTPTPPVSPSGVSIPIGDLPGWHQTFADDFTIDAPLGSWGTSNSNAVVYTGDHGGKWIEYPDGWPSTYSAGKPGYQPAQVLSVHNGILDFHLHQYNGLPSGANPTPLVTGTSKYQTYGRYDIRMRADTGLTDYHAALLLWPNSDANGGCAESDFPEGSLAGTVSAFAHNSTTCSNYSVQDVFNTSTRFDSGWHTYTQEWSPGSRKYYIDGTLIGQSTTRVWSQDERWQLQIEPKGTGASNGHVTVDWVTAYSYAP
jgi:hypothetical protein